MRKILLVFVFGLLSAWVPGPAAAAEPLDQWLLRVEDLMTTGRQSEGRKECERLLKVHPKVGEAWTYLGNCLAALDQYDEAKKAYKKAVKYLPKSMREHRSKSYLWLGVIARRSKAKNAKSLDHSVKMIRNSIKELPTGEAYYHLTLTLFMKSDFEAAIASSAKCVATGFSGRSAGLYHNCYEVLSHLLSAAHDWKGCNKLLERELILAQIPDAEARADVHFFKGACHSFSGKGSKQQKKAEKEFAEARKLSPKRYAADQIQKHLDEWFKARKGHHLAMRQAGFFNHAADVIKRELAQIQPLSPMVISHRRLHQAIWPATLRDDAYAEARRQRIVWRRDPLSDSFYRGNLIQPFMCLQLPGVSAEHCKWIARVYSHQTHNMLHLGEFEFTFDHSARRKAARVLTPADTLTVGLLSADLARLHPMLRVLKGFLNGCDRRRLKLVLFSVKAFPSITTALEKQVDKIVDLSQELNSKKAAQLIYDEQVQVLVDLSGRTGSNRPDLVSHKPAPVIVAWGGFPGTSGEAAVDYFLADRNNVPGGASAYYSEKILYLPGTWLVNNHKAEFGDAMKSVRHDKTQQKATRDTLHLPSEAFVFGNVGRLWKIDSRTFDAWCAIITRVPHSVLWLIEFGDRITDVYTAKTNLQSEWSRTCPGGKGRLFFSPKQENGAHVKLWSAMDVMLDTSSYNGGMTTVDALFAGVPVVTTPGLTNKFPERMGTSLLNAAGLPELVADDTEEYIEIAVRLGTSPSFLQSVRTKLATSVVDESLLFRPDLQAKHIELGLRAAWNIWAQGQPTRDIDVAALLSGSGNNRTGVVDGAGEATWLGSLF